MLVSKNNDKTELFPSERGLNMRKLIFFLVNSFGNSFMIWAFMDYFYCLIFDWINSQIMIHNGCSGNSRTSYYSIVFPKVKDFYCRGRDGNLILIYLLALIWCLCVRQCGVFCLLSVFFVMISHAISWKNCRGWGRLCLRMGFSSIEEFLS